MEREKEAVPAIERPDILLGRRKEGWLEGSDMDSLLAVGPMELLPGPVTDPIDLQGVSDFSHTSQLQKVQHPGPALLNLYNQQDLACQISRCMQAATLPLEQALVTTAHVLLGVMAITYECKYPSDILDTYLVRLPLLLRVPPDLPRSNRSAVSLSDEEVQEGSPSLLLPAGWLVSASEARWPVVDAGGCLSLPETVLPCKALRMKSVRSDFVSREDQV